ERKGHVVREGRPGTRHVLVRATAAGRELGEAEDPLAQAAGRLEPELRDAALEAALTMIAALVDDGTITVTRTCLTCRFHRRDDVGSHCDLLKVPLPPGDLRVNCPEHRSAAWAPSTRRAPLSPRPGPRSARSARCRGTPPDARRRAGPRCRGAAPAGSRHPRRPRPPAPGT